MLEIIQPDDFHLHLRDGLSLKRTVTDSAQTFARALIMPNLNPPIVSVKQAEAYRQRILAEVPKNCFFEPLMTLYLTNTITSTEIIKAKKSGIIFGCKLYPQGATTNSEHGVQQIQSLYPLFETMEKEGMVLQIHGEVTDPHIDVFEREQKFIDDQLIPITRNFPHLKIVLEHITTSYAVTFIQQTSDFCAATITAHHLHLNRNHLLSGRIRPHYYCLPILKKETDRLALIQAATSGHPRFFLGTDSAPHPRTQKESACGCAGIYTAHAALELYAEVFAEHQALDKLENFASCYGADFYGLSRNTTKIRLIQEEQIVPEVLTFGEDKLIPFKASEKIAWKVKQLN